ncbi:MAG: alpha/beta hydrolase, partial [Acidimicrobiales bacterium]|nr:alpha/beta hydrolase [Acidimicrobiales bacterium]
TSELPLHAMAYQMVRTARHLRRHGLRSPSTQAGIALSVASWMVLRQLHRDAARTAEAFEEAFATLGSPASVPAEAAEVPTVNQVVNPFANGRGRYLRASDLAYATDAGPRHRLDVWAPDGLGAEAARPVLLQVHGGGWCIGNKEQQGGPLMTEMCDRGWVCVAINYRLSPRATWPDHIVDVKRSIAWIRENIAEYGGDPGFIAVTGGSAGGHLAALAALTGSDTSLQPGFEHADTTVQAAVPLYGVYDFTNRDGTGRDDMEDFLAKFVFKATKDDDPNLWDSASPMAHLGSEAPPMLIVHGTNDGLVPVEQARSFATALARVSEQPTVFVELPGTQHAFDVFGSVRTRYAVQEVGRFLDHVHRSRQQ